MAQQQPNEFTYTEFSDAELNDVLLSFTEAQLWYLQNHRSAAALTNVKMVFEPDDTQLQKNIREQAYQLGRIELITDVFEDVAAARRAAAEAQADAASSTKTS